VKHNWKIYEGTKYIGSGQIEADSERDALVKVLAGDHKVKPDKSYRITVGSVSTSSYGDEFEKSADVAGWGSDEEQAPLDGGHLFKPKLSDVGVTSRELAERIANGVMREAIDKCKVKFVNPNFQGYPFIPLPCEVDSEFDALTKKGSCPCWDMNGTILHPGTQEYHAQCVDCGYVDPRGTGRFAPGTAARKLISSARPGSGEVAGVAIHDAKGGEVVQVWLNDPSRYVYVVAGCPMHAGDSVMVNQHNTAYMPRKVTAHPGEPANITNLTLHKPKQGPMVTEFTMTCYGCGFHSQHRLMGSAPFDGIPCPGCGATYAVEKNS
jgi:hypothetical protein